jgi:hypothetical protein
MSQLSPRNSILILLVALGQPACGDIDSNAIPAVSEKLVATADSSAKSPVPIASLTLKNGNVVEFYDFGSSALISESGAAYSAPMLSFREQKNDLVLIWESLAPQTPVPAALTSLQTRLASLPQRASVSAGTLGPKLVPNVGGLPSVVPDSPVGCSNGCCDYQWLSTFEECRGTYLDFKWFLYNYGYTWANYNAIIFYEGLVCSAQGTSTWTVNIGGNGGVWGVPEATWRSWGWMSPDLTVKNLRSTVNTSANMHLHTYCGGGHDG